MDDTLWDGVVALCWGVYITFADRAVGYECVSSVLTGNNPRKPGLFSEYRQNLGLVGVMEGNKPRNLALFPEYRQKLGLVGVLERRKPTPLGLLSKSRRDPGHVASGLACYRYTPRMERPVPCTVTQCATLPRDLSEQQCEME